VAGKAWSPNRKLLLVLGVFLAAYFVPFGAPRVSGALSEAFLMLGDYARQHVLLCLVPAMFIAGAITVFLNQQAVMRYLGPDAKKPVAYGVAAFSGAILAVCSCTVLPLFKGIYKKGAGLGPAVAFLYSGPAINILAIVLSAKVFGIKLGAARAIVFSVVIGLLMALIFRKDDRKRAADARLFTVPDEKPTRNLGQMSVYMVSMIGILLFANWANSKGGSVVWDFVFQAKWWITGGFGLLLLYVLIRWFKKEELSTWVVATRDFSLQILPLLFAGVLVSGFLLGRPGKEALIPSQWITSLVGGNSLLANFIASFGGALMYFATLTEIPIVQGLIGAGMGQGPALALLLAGPSLSLPSILVIAGELGWPKTLTYVGLVVGLSTGVGMLFGAIA
jgi:uncharacterized membrane protein YraQ (UPF0718 family)